MAATQQRNRPSNRTRGRGQGTGLAPRAERHHLSRHVPLLAENRGALDPAGSRRLVEAAGSSEGAV